MKQNQKDIQNQLDKLQDDFQDWKAIYGAKVPNGYEEPKDQAKIRQMFINDIKQLKEKLSQFKNN
jgi:hypothetical protein